MFPKQRKNIRYKNLKEFTNDDIKTIGVFLELVHNENKLYEAAMSCKFIGKGEYSKAWREGNVIVKLSRSTQSAIPNRKDKEYKYCIPTIECLTEGYKRRDIIPATYPPEDFPVQRLIFQKVADTRYCLKDVDFFLKKMKNSTYDIHSDNVGRYKGKPVIFDC